MGFLWGVWHYLVALWLISGTSSGKPSPAIFLPALIFYVASLPAYRVLMVWAYDRTGQSLLVAMLMHAVFSASKLILRLLIWRVDARWYAVALLAGPLSMIAVLAVLSPLGPEYLPRILTASDKPALLLMGIAVGLAAGIFEEVGWTGFAIPRMRLRYGILGTGLIVGVLWSVWHFLVNFWASGVTSGSISPSLFLPMWLVGVLVGQLTPFRVLIVWVYDRTGSLLVSMLMHISLAAFTVILTPTVPGTAYWIIGFAYAAAVGVIVAAVVIANHGHLLRRQTVVQQGALR